MLQHFPQKNFVFTVDVNCEHTNNATTKQSFIPLISYHISSSYIYEFTNMFNRMNGLDEEMHERW